MLSLFAQISTILSMAPGSSCHIKCSGLNIHSSTKKVAILDIFDL